MSRPPTGCCAASHHRRHRVGERDLPHSLRHSYATALLDHGVPLADVQDAMEHADPRTTRRYDRHAGALHRSPSYRMADELTKAMRTA
ncbi:tyrosine-type recombinase/integrase [Streptomyces sp. NPDC056231]|uniref:tyrosine-type recombinase/integrase n=1 Tax=Streptomyces sp. NPDC056231 TaxID=3345755 RepID=UPI003AAF75AA